MMNNMVNHSQNETANIVKSNLEGLNDIAAFFLRETDEKKKYIDSAVNKNKKRLHYIQNGKLSNKK
jgi:hypothetical protein